MYWLINLGALLGLVALVAWCASFALRYLTDWFHDWKEGIEQ